jgi:hypothetical protein
METYAVRVTREDHLLLVEISALDGLTQARTLDEVAVMAREYISLTLDVAEDSFDIVVEIALP